MRGAGAGTTLTGGMGDTLFQNLPEGPLRDALFGAVLAGTSEYIACIDRQHRFVLVNRTMGRPMSQVLGTKFEEYLVTEQQQPIASSLERAFADGEPQRIEYTVRLSDATLRHMIARVVPFSVPGAEPMAVLFVDDDTDRRRLAEKLQQSVDFQQRVVEHFPGFVTLVDREHRFVWVNRVAPGLALSDVVGKHVEDFVAPSSVVPTRAAIDAAFKSAASSQYETEGYSDGQNLARYLVRAVPVSAGGRVENVLMITTDVTELKQAEQALRETQAQLHQAQRLEGIGQLAGGIAHDFNNLLQVIAGNVSFARHALKSGRPVQGELDQALRATERAAELTSHLLAVGRRQRLDPKRVNLGDLVSANLRMLRRIIPENIDIQCQVSPEPCFVDLDAPQFEQVLLNLCVNARDAMPQGGTLTVRVALHPDNQVELSVTDSGVGIDPVNLARVFEPFFTTKGTGSGLGLAVAAGIIAAHSGKISAHSDGRSGTSIRIVLPRAEAVAAPKPLSSRPDQGGVGVVLVAEDEEIVREQVVKILEGGGYAVISVRNGAEAVEQFAKRSDTIDLIVLDVVMPVLDGWQAFLRIKALNPNINAIFTTGYAADVLPEDFATQGARLLRKPFRPAQLLAQVREMLVPADRPSH
ncbi:MAG TPA: ATP-binding protein [Polyangiaceae bacterium]|nr:ATP-binding protein [Polyangiaceae bacterium]